MKRLITLSLGIIIYSSVFSQWKTNENNIYYKQGGVIIGDSIPTSTNSKLSIQSSHNTSGGGGYGILLKHSSNNSLLVSNSSTAIGYSSIWSTQAQSAGISSTLTLLQDNASEYENYNAGGSFRLTFKNYTPSGSNLHYLGGTYSLLDGNISYYPSQSIISAVIGEDRIKSKSTYAGYFLGNGFFSDKLGIGVTNPNEKLEIDGNIKFKEAGTGLILKSPDGTEWKITVDNNGILTSNQTISLKSITTDYNISVFPNPSTELITVEVNDLNIDSFDAEIYDLSGKMLFMKNYTSKRATINISDFKIGNYLLKIADNSGNIIKTEKIVKQ